MARQIKPADAPAIEAKQYNVPDVDWSVFEKAGDAEIQAANNNYKLYAQTLISKESSKLYEQFKNDPINLSNALAKLPEMIADLPEEIRDSMTKNMYLNSVALVQRAEKNRVALIDAQNKRNSDYLVDTSRTQLIPTYINLLQNNSVSADKKSPVINDIYLKHVNSLQSLADLKNSNGDYVYSEEQKKKIRNLSDSQLEGFKQYVDGMILNDNEDLEKSKAYYQEHVLAPERFMAENYMDRATYEKAHDYLKKQLERAGADIKKARFKQSVKDYLDLQVADLPGRTEALKEAGYLNSAMIDNMGKINVKFNEIDPSKTESPLAMINLLQIVNDLKSLPTPRTEADQQKILEQGTATLDAIADYAQTYGLSPAKVRSIRETVVNAETDAAFRPILENFGEIIDNFQSKMTTIRNISTGKGGLKTAWRILTGADNISYQEAKRLYALNNLLAVSTDKINQQIRNGDWAGIRQTQRETQQKAAEIYYDWIDWQEARSNPDYIAEKNGRFVKVKGFTENGDIKVEIV